MGKQNYVQYDTSKKDYASYNRKYMTQAEKIMREKVLRRKQTWYSFLRQKILWPFIADFYCSKLLLVVEIDWNSHKDKEVYDINRTDIINDLWVKVIRYTNDEVLNNLEIVKDNLLSEINNRQKHIDKFHSK